MGKSWKDIDRKRPLPYPTRMCRKCFGNGWVETWGSNAADGLQTTTCTICAGEGRMRV